jgi:two-component system OmpR family response regulator
MATDDPRPPLSILVVEDEEDGANSLAELLRLFGYRVAVARTGSAALRAAEADSPDVVLLDIRLPDIDGWEVARRMRDAATGGPQPVVVAVTGCSSERDKWRSADAGIDLHWTKPADPAVLLATLARFAGFLDRAEGKRPHGQEANGVADGPAHSG